MEIKAKWVGQLFNNWDQGTLALEVNNPSWPRKEWIVFEKEEAGGYKIKGRCETEGYESEALALDPAGLIVWRNPTGTDGGALGFCQFRTGKFSFFYTQSRTTFEYKGERYFVEKLIGEPKLMKFDWKTLTAENLIQADYLVHNEGISHRVYFKRAKDPCIRYFNLDSSSESELTCPGAFQELIIDPSTKGILYVTRPAGLFEVDENGVSQKIQHGQWLGGVSYKVSKDGQWIFTYTRGGSYSPETIGLLHRATRAYRFFRVKNPVYSPDFEKLDEFFDSSGLGYWTWYDRTGFKMKALAIDTR